MWLAAPTKRPTKPRRCAARGGWHPAARRGAGIWGLGPGVTDWVASMAAEALEALDQDWRNLSKLSLDLRADPDVVLAAIHIDGRALMGGRCSMRPPS